MEAHHHVVAGLNAVDDNIGRVMSFLESSGQLDDTVILHSSDHGYFLGEWRCFEAVRVDA